MEEDPQPVSTAPITDRPGPKVIKLDDEPLSQSVLLVHNETVHLAGSSRPELRRSSGSLKASKWLPPPNIAIYLSTIELPDLKPGRREQLRTASGSTGGKVLPEPPQGTAESKGSGSSKDGKLGRLFRTRS